MEKQIQRMDTNYTSSKNNASYTTHVHVSSVVCVYKQTLLCLPHLTDNMNTLAIILSVCLFAVAFAAPYGGR